MTKLSVWSPLKIGLFVVVISYFLFTFKAMFTLSWVGEWEAFEGYLRLIILTEDVSAATGVAFRLVASAIALVTVTLYFTKKSFSTDRVKKLFRIVLVAEAFYWLGLLTTAVLSLTSSFGITIWRVNGHVSTIPLATSLLIYEIPLLIQSIGIPAMLLKLSSELKPNKPLKGAIKWGLITGTLYIFVFWLTGTTMWTSTILRQGIQYVTIYPENMFSFLLTTFGLLALTFFTAFFAKKHAGTESLEKLDARTIGSIVTALGLFFFWNYMNWIFFGKDETWSYWYLWFLGNLNLWLLTLPLLGLPLLFKRRPTES